MGVNPVSPGYFRTARIGIVEGRLPDSVTAVPLGAKPFSFSQEVVVNRALARRLWPNGGAVGARVRTVFGGPRPPGMPAEPWSTVVGVVDDTRMPGLVGDFRALQVYPLANPRAQIPITLIVRTAGSAEDAMLALEKAIKVDRTLLVWGSQSGEAYLRDSLAPSRFAMALLTAFAIIALVLAAAGLYGVISYGVTQRTREIGVRVALGADAGAIRSLVVGGGVRLAVFGVVIGTGAAAAATRLLDNMLYGVSPADPMTFVGVAVLVGAIAMVASYMPARRALRIDPTEALRAD
jgi:hypothetical protein